VLKDIPASEKNLAEDSSSDFTVRLTYEISDSQGGITKFPADNANAFVHPLRVLVSNNSSPASSPAKSQDDLHACQAIAVAVTSSPQCFNPSSTSSTVAVTSDAGLLKTQHLEGSMR